MLRLRAALKPALSLLIVASAVFFFARAFRNNWAAVSAHSFRLDGPLLFIAFVATVLTLLLATYAWHISINSFLTGDKITFSQSMAAVNSSGLTKYIPGKVWSYALQLYWLADLGLSKSVVVYVNLLNLLVSMITALLLGLACLVFSSTKLPLAVSLAPFCVLLLFDVVWVKFDAALLDGVVSVVNRIFKKNITFLGVPGHLLFRLHLVHGAANGVSGCSAYLLCRAMNYHLEPRATLLVVAATLVSDVIGFLAFLVPGGIGVREGMMYMMLDGTSTGPLALLLPLVSRVVSMVADIGVGVVALKLLRGFLRGIQSQRQNGISR